ncbi:MAG: type II toxin-antitoxin system prevent-host-death family antitoxin [Actinomycetota bacterium]|nr:type II toxin-antitoxin system prevent-host-death family antitoxin [Actinomycetota bacterium]
MASTNTHRAEVKPATTMTSREFNHDTGVAKKAAARGPVVITDRGRPSHVLLSYEDYERLASGTPRLTELLSRTPGVGAIDFEVPERDELAEPARFD